MKRPETPAEGAIRYEHRDVTQRGMLIFGIAFVATVVAIIVGVTALSRGLWRVDREPVARPWAEGPTVGPPRLQVSPPADLARFRAEKRQWLEGYGWIDRDAGIAHIPIERAMRLEAARAAKEGRP